MVADTLAEIISAKPYIPDSPAEAPTSWEISFTSAAYADTTEVIHAPSDSHR